MSVIKNLYTGADPWEPRLFILNRVKTATVTASTADTGHAATAVVGPQTYSTWSPLSFPAWVRAQLAASYSINFVAAYIADGGGCTFVAETWNGSAWVACGTSVLVTTRTAVVWYFDARTTNDVRLYVTDVTGATQPYIANLKCGTASVCPVGIPSGFVPGSISPDNEYTNTMTNGGQILAAERIRSEMMQAVTLEKVEPAWVRSDFAVIAETMRTEGVYFAWNADDYPDELVYGMVDGKPQASYSSPTFMQASFSLRGPSP